MSITTTRITLALVLALVACGGGGSGTSDETTTSTTNGETSSESSSSTTVTPTTQPQDTSESGDPHPCPYYGFESLPMGNVGTAYDFIPDPTDEPDFWTAQYEGEIPGLELGATISGVPEEEGRFMVTQMLARSDGAQCQVEMTTLVIGPPLPGDSTGTETGTETGTDSSGGSDSSSDGGSSSGSSTGV